MTKGFDIAVAQGRIVGKGEIHAVEQAAIEISAQAAEIAIVAHQVEGDAEHPDFDDMGTDAAEYPNDYPYSMFNS